MDRMMVNLLKIDPIQLAEETGVTPEDVEKVVNQMAAHRNDHQRQPREPVPKGGISKGLMIGREQA